MSATPEVLWEPSGEAAAASRIGAFAQRIAANHGVDVGTYERLWQWSIDELDTFWAEVWAFFDVRATVPYEDVRVGEMPDTRWFPGARLNYAEHTLRYEGDGPAVIARSQSRTDVTLTWPELRTEVARVHAAMSGFGLLEGDVVAGYLPNVPEAVVAFLAAASLGCTWMSCPPEFGVQAVLDRFAPMEPKLLIAVDGYRYGALVLDRHEAVDQLRAGLPSVEHAVWLGYLDPNGPVPSGMTAWASLPMPADAVSPIEFAQVPSDHPLYVLFSSGTTGPPKAIVHGHGGILVEHLKVLGLHGDLGPNDRFSWFTTTGWMMWNYLVSGLLHGATIVLFDGNPGSPDLRTLWQMGADLGVTWFGGGAPFLAGCEKAGLLPGDEVDLSRIRAVGATGAPLSAEAARWVYEAVGADLLLSSISGGTDVCSAFVGGSPNVPVWAGEISCRYLGADVQAFSPGGERLIGEQGELVVCRPMPSMPVGFAHDPDRSTFRAAYFERFPGVWHHGDWITVTERGSCIISGRSDATLNRGGVRIGSAEIYRVVERVPGVVDSLVVHLEDGDAGTIVLLVVIDGDEHSIAAEIRARVRSALSPRHVPDEIHVVDAIPTTLSGKKMEVPVKRILLGAAAERVAAADGMRDPTALDAVVALAASRSAR